LIDGSDWPLFYLRWELRLLEDMGFGLDLTKCAVTNVKEDLAYISPKSGCAISKNAAGVWVNKLLPLPECLKVGGPTSMADLSIGFEVTGYFLNKWIVPQMNGKPLPVARMRLTDALTRLFKHQNLN